MKQSKIKFRRPLAAFLLSRILAKFAFILPRGYSRVRYPGGYIHLPLRDSYRMIDKVTGVYEYQKTQLIRALIRPHMTVIDVGANVGYYSLLSASLMHCTGRVLAFEPYPELVHWLRKSIEINNYACIDLYEIALGEKHGAAVFYPGKKSGWGSLVYSEYASDPKSHPIEVVTASLDEILREAKIDRVDLIKIDVEGTELMVLQGMKETLLTHNVHLIVDVDTVKCQDERNTIYRYLVGMGYKLYRLQNGIVEINIIEDELKEIYATKDPV